MICGDALEVLRTLPAESVDCCVTSPPYWGLRSYLPDDSPEKGRELGHEPSIGGYVSAIADIFDEVLRALTPEGTAWLNIGDRYVASPPGSPRPDHSGNRLEGRSKGQGYAAATKKMTRPDFGGLKLKNQIGLPWRVAFALQDRGWILRKSIIWHKPNAMPSPAALSRPMSSHEEIFFLVKNVRHYYDAEAVQEPAVATVSAKAPPKFGGKKYPGAEGGNTYSGREYVPTGFRSLRDVWSIPTVPSGLAHYATFPPEIPRRCILAGCPYDGVVLDPFAGTGVTGAEALKLGRRFVGIDLNPEYCRIAEERLRPFGGITRLSEYGRAEA